MDVTRRDALHAVALLFVRWPHRSLPIPVDVASSVQGPMTWAVYGWDTISQRYSLITIVPQLAIEIPAFDYVPAWPWGSLVGVTTRQWNGYQERQEWFLQQYRVTQVQRG